MKAFKNDVVVIEHRGMKVEGTVLSANHWGESEGWYIEMIDTDGMYRYWKQGEDGGELLEVKHDVKRLDIKEWENIFRNLEEDGEEVQISWLDGTDEWCLHFDYELFEDGFKTEREANIRLEYLQKSV